ncbi:hypothetical protein KHA80_15220 [Anaerobacillus sp. HL2]|nr:hypothetical protein KHA80_15220 [Anaerobacillus sp. HL2]
MTFEKKHPKIKIHLIIDKTATILEKIIHNKIDLAIVAKKIDDPNFNIQPLFQDKIHAYCSIENKSIKIYISSLLS